MRIIDQMYVFINHLQVDKKDFSQKSTLLNSMGPAAQTLESPL